MGGQFGWSRGSWLLFWDRPFQGPVTRRATGSGEVHGILYMYSLGVHGVCVSVFTNVFIRRLLAQSPLAFCSSRPADRLGPEATIQLSQLQQSSPSPPTLHLQSVAMRFAQLASSFLLSLLASNVFADDSVSSRNIARPVAAP